VVYVLWREQELGDSSDFFLAFCVLDEDGDGVEVAIGHDNDAHVVDASKRFAFRESSAGLVGTLFISKRFWSVPL